MSVPLIHPTLRNLILYKFVVDLFQMTLSRLIWVFYMLIPVLKQLNKQSLGCILCQDS